MTEVSLRLSEDAVDHNGVARMTHIAPGPANDDSTIAPWLDIPPTPPPKSPLRSFNFPKVSVSSIATTRNGSYSNGSRYPRHSESQSTLSIPPDNRRSVEGDGDSSRHNFYSGSSSHSNEIRKSKSSIGLNVLSKLRGRPSKANLALSDSKSTDASQHPSLQPPEPPLPSSSFMNLASANSSFLSLGKSAKGKEKRKQSRHPPTPPEKDELEHQHLMDLDIRDMSGIIDPRAHSAQRHEPSSPSLSSGRSDYGVFLRHQPAGSDYRQLQPSDFSNPFVKSSSHSGRRANDRRISPTTVISPNGTLYRHHATNSIISTGAEGSPTWVPPESWAVENYDEDAMEAAAYSSSDESVHGSHSVDRPTPLTERPTLPPPVADPSTPKAMRRKRPRSSHSDKLIYRMKIFHSNGSWRHVAISLDCTVAQLNKELFAKAKWDSDRKDRLYLSEGGRERLLGPTERPAKIVKRRLTLAGYLPIDGLDTLGLEDLPFLFRFSYKSQLLGPPEEDLNFESFDFIDLTGRSLRTIPVLLHQNADSIVSLKLSRNPMLEIPLDFIQSCSLLRDLRLSNMAMKKVPQSVQYSSTLHRLDLSSNRIADLTDAYLDHIPNLLELNVMNNKLEKLPWHFGRLRCLVTLNISNNRFTEFPKEVFQMKNLRTLDVSFNTIKVIPEELGQLAELEHFLLVGNQISKFPDQARELHNLSMLDCRRNSVSDLTIVLMLPKIQQVYADHNAISSLDLSIGPNMKGLDVSHNDITQLSLIPGPVGRSPYSLTSLDLSYTKLSSLDDLALGTLTSLKTLKLDHNTIRSIPDTLGELSWLETLTVSDNRLDSLPDSIGRLQKLETLDAHNNSLSELPQSLWNCASLTRINVTSNFLGSWHDPPVSSDVGIDDASSLYLARKGSTASTTSTSGLPPLVHSLERLYLGENRLTEESIHPLMIFKELRVLNLSFNELQELPPIFFRNMTQLEELYLSGNKLTSIPTEDLHRMTRLSTLFLNGNRLQTLPQELGKLKDLSILDVGSNMLKYNINNWEFDWNWNFNKKLKYLNLSGNNRLQIKSESSRNSASHNRTSRLDFASLGRQTLAGFKELASLRVLGLMDVTIATTGTDASVDIPDETDIRRVRTSPSTVNGMAYGIADSLGRNDVLNMLDLVREFPASPGEPKPNKAIFAMFGRCQPPKGLLPGTSPNKLSKFLHDHFTEVFIRQMNELPEKKGGVSDALRRTFLELNQKLWEHIHQLKRKNSQATPMPAPNGTLVNSGFDPGLLNIGATSVVLYVVDKRIYVANVGDAVAVLSRAGVAHRLSHRHHPYDREETAHIRSAEGWVSPNGLINDQVEVSRSFGHFNLVPVVRAAPDIFSQPLGDRDEFIIIANRGLWEFVPHQTAVDIARTVAHIDPMIAAQKLRDFAISYGADGSTMIMVIMVSDLFKDPRSRQPTLDNIVLPAKVPKRKKEERIPGNRHLPPEVDAPTGHIAIAFTDIRNSTHLWEVNPGMPTAMHLHNHLLRYHLRRCGGYEVKTEGDSFMVSFPTALAAVWWCVTVQKELLNVSWPLEILECEDGKEIRDEAGNIIARGLSVRMGIHCGVPVCETDWITNRMDYFGSMVNRSARVNSHAQGGQIMVSADVLREINARIYDKVEEQTEYSRNQPQDAIDGIREIGISLIPVGEVKLKGFEFTEMLTAVYPKGLEHRHGMKDANVSGAASRIQFSVPQTKELGILCLRLEALSGGYLFKTPPPARKGSIASQTASLLPGAGPHPGSSSNTTEEATSNEAEAEPQGPPVIVADPETLLPPINDQISDADLMRIIDWFAMRIENAVNMLAHRYCPPNMDRVNFINALIEGEQLDARTLEYISGILKRIS
ncbi:adenylate cyclase [Coprinopsis cinerea okayama7|uniref:Adenylate cyclase n=1 Tax=Coprinopsis cinerea (strain Okayama-7 / 130 / ATCC MYA-4618 / FGSC 9003) TaxID=240176 RepID=A8N7T3_COPC7|nr:adenylate cyclase [Coprinopsis cinerea okayama7\|eukprot:XP_001830889.2 adenylate cyclase [Coprinopsis cinerea okayama7\